MTTFGLLIFDGAEELDFVGPWEVFTASAMLQAEFRCGRRHLHDHSRARGPHPLPPRACGSVADHGFSNHPPLDVLLVPGGVGRPPGSVERHPHRLDRQDRGEGELGHRRVHRGLVAA